MMSILILKILVSFVFLLFYVVQWKKIVTNEARICFLFFFVLYFVGGAVVSIVIEDVDYFLPESGLYQVNGSILSWLLYFTIIYLIPYLFVWIVEVINRPRNIDGHNQITPISIRWLTFSFFVYFFFLYVNVDFGEVVNSANSGYADQVNSRYSLNLSPLFNFISLVCGFLLCYSLVVTSMLNKKGIFISIVSLLVFLIVVERVFFSKLYFLGLVASLLIAFLIFSKVSKIKIFIVSFFCLGLFFVYYNLSVYGEVSYILSPLVKATTRYSMPIYYYVDYYLVNDFEGGFYFSGLLTGHAQDYIRDVYNHAFLISDVNVVGTLSSGLIVHNFVNLGAFTVILSCLEFSFLIFVYRIFRIESGNIINLSIFSFLIFSVMNYSFMSVLVNPSSGFALIFLILFITKFFRQLR